MHTTIQVSKTTKQLLEMVKEQKEAASYDEVIKTLLKKDMKIPDSMFGVDKGLKWNKKTDRMKFHEW
ncbi:MAG TPA: hypothetical protein VJG90_00200 [Candidatus Nanoarchaeia archaeon]|nr:hypothetical protein [Candidatus Nanoarchaeia archaeon]